METKDKYGSPADIIKLGRRLGYRPGVDYTPGELHQCVMDYLETMRVKVWNKVEAVRAGDAAGMLYEVPTQTPLSLSGFFLMSGLTKGRWEKYRENETYAPICELLENAVYTQNLEGAAVGAYNANLVARVHKIAEKTETTANVQIEGITGMKIGG